MHARSSSENCHFRPSSLVHCRHDPPVRKSLGRERGPGVSPATLAGAMTIIFEHRAARPPRGCPHRNFIQLCVLPPTRTTVRAVFRVALNSGFRTRLRTMRRGLPRHFRLDPHALALSLLSDRCTGDRFALGLERTVSR